MEQQIDKLIAEIKAAAEKITLCTKTCNAEELLSCYENSPSFLAVTGDGRMRDYRGFEEICRQYYGAVEYQDVETIREEFRPLIENTILFAWTGNITAHFENGDTMVMNSYSVTFVFKKMMRAGKLCIRMNRRYRRK